MIKVRRICGPEIPVPSRAHSTDAGYDLRYAGTEETTLYGHSRKILPSGFCWEIPSGFAGLVKSRSGMFLKHHISAFHGLIDSGYRDELKIILLNHDDRPYIIKPNTRIAQLVILPVLALQVQEVAELSKSDRGTGGFGSTGS